MKKRTWISAVAVVMAFVLAGCSSGKQNSGSPAQASRQEMKSSYNMDAGMGVPVGAAEEYEAAYDADAEDVYVAETGASDTASDKKIVWTGYLRVESTEYDKTMQEMLDLFSRSQAIIESSEEYDGSDWYYGGNARKNRTMNWQVRIPSANFQHFFEDAGSLSGQIRSRSTSSSDRTKQYNDTAVQIESLTIQQANLLAMMEKATEIEDMLAIEERLTEVRTQLRILSNSNSQIDYDVQYSSVNVQLSEVQIYEKTELTYGQRLAQAAGNSLVEFIEALGDFLVSLIYAIPYLVVLAIAAFLGRKIWKSRKARKQDGQEKAKRFWRKWGTQKAGIEENTENKEENMKTEEPKK